MNQSLSWQSSRLAGAVSRGQRELNVVLSCSENALIGLFCFVLYFSVFKDKAIRGMVELLDCLDGHVSCCTVLCAFPLVVGFVCVFCALFRLPNLGQGYN